MNAVRSWLDAKLATGRWQDALQSRASQAAVWVLAVALGVQAAILVTRWAGAGASSAQLPVVTPSSTARRAVDVAAIASAHLFGAAPGVSGENAGAPATRMALVLTGTIATNRPEYGLAILGPDAGTVKVYAVGDTVPGGARLHAVYDDRVLLDHDGRLESLMLVHEQAGGAAAAARAVPVERAVERVRQLMTQNPGILETVIRPQPVFAGGKLAGYRVYPGPDTRAFASLGLRAGDLVTAIDGTPLDDPSRSEEIFRTLGSSSEAHVTVVRAGRKQDLDLNLARIASEADQLTHGAAGSSEPNRLGRVP